MVFKILVQFICIIIFFLIMLLFLNKRTNVLLYEWNQAIAQIEEKGYNRNNRENVIRIQLQNMKIFKII